MELTTEQLQQLAQMRELLREYQQYAQLPHSWSSEVIQETEFQAGSLVEQTAWLEQYRVPEE